MKFRLISIVTLLLFCHCGYTQKKNAQPPLFTVKGAPVSTEEFIYLFNKNHQGKSPGSKEVEEYLDLFINFKLKVREARERGLDTTRTFRQEFATYRTELIKPYLPDNRIIDSLVAVTYERLKTEVRASHILLMVKEGSSEDEIKRVYDRAFEIKKRAAAGEDFASLALLYSEDQSVRMNKGDLGYFTALQMVYPFESAVYEGNIGEVVGPVKTQFGYHIIRVTDKQPSRGEVEVSHIMVRSADPKDEKAREKIFEIQNMLQSGAPWDETCAEYSEDQNSKGNKGKLRAFGVGVMASVPAFESAAFSLQNPGDISDPVQTSYGWHIIKLDRKIPLRSLDEMKPSLKNSVLKDERFAAAKSSLMQRYRKDLRFTEMSETKRQVIRLADSSFLKGKWKPVFNMPGEVLFTLSDQKYTAGNFLAFAEKHQGGVGLSPADALTRQYEAYVDDCLLKIVEENAVKSSPELRMLTNEYYEGILLFTIMETEVWNKAAQDSVGQVNYFESHKQSYQAGDRLHATIFMSENRSLLDSVYFLASKGDSTGAMDLAVLNTARYESGRFEPSDRAVLGKVSRQVGLFPVDLKDTHYLVWVHGLVPPGPKTFDEARAQVISDFQNQVEQDWINTLKQKYPVKINAKGRAYAFEKLLQ